MISVKADYLGGDTRSPKQINDGFLSWEAGALKFSAVEFQNMLPVHVTGPSVDAVLAMSVGSSKLKRKGKGTAFLIGGVAGVAIHAKTTGKRTCQVLVVGTRDGSADRVVLQYAASTEDAHKLLTAIQMDRLAKGLAAVPPVEALPAVAA